MTAHEELFQRLQDRAEIKALIGKTENLHLDCKTWPASDTEGQRILAKALAGFANAEGGVVVIGLETKPAQKYDPDLITGELPVVDAVALKARLEALVGELVEPPVQGVRIEAVPEQPGSKAGFVLVDVPPTDGFPARSRKTSHFYQRLGSGTYQMEYFQIADMFGRRRRPALELNLGGIEITAAAASIYGVVRTMMLGLKNSGRGIARFPSVRLIGAGLRVDPMFGADGNGNFELRQQTADPGVIAFGGGVDNVIHPGTTLKIAKLMQNAHRSQYHPSVYLFDSVSVAVEMFAEDVEVKTANIQLQEQNFSQ